MVTSNTPTDPTIPPGHVVYGQPAVLAAARDLPTGTGAQVLRGAGGTSRGAPPARAPSRVPPRGLAGCFTNTLVFPTWSHLCLRLL